jgi:hypothetical protein
MIIRNVMIKILITLINNVTIKNIGLMEFNRTAILGLDRMTNLYCVQRKEEPLSKDLSEILLIVTIQSFPPLRETCD